jgi:hypothetical protein
MAWNAIAYLFPNLHPDADENEWPQVFRPFHSEACRRLREGSFVEDEFYPSDAQWCGLFDRLARPTPSETCRRIEISAEGTAAE